MRELSIYKTMKPGESFALIDTLEAEQDEFAVCNSKPKVKIKQARRSVEIDQDVVDTIRKRFGIMPLGRAIRIILGLNPKVAQDAWQEEEDRLLREYYPEHGSKALTEALGRKPHSIRERASALGIRRAWKYKRDRRQRVQRSSVESKEDD